MRRPLAVQIILFDGFDLLDAIGPYEVFQAAEMFSNGGVKVDLVSSGGARSVASGLGGLKIPTSGAPDLEEADIILLPGAAGPLDPDHEGSVPSLLARESSGPIADVAREALERADVTVATVCGGSLVLGLAGLIRARPAVTHHLGMAALAASGATPVKARVVDDGMLVTGAGVTSGVDLALHLVERELGPRFAHAVENLLEHERRGIVWRNAGPTPVGFPETSAVETVAGAPSAASSATIEGCWDLTIFTPIGEQRASYEFRLANGVLVGNVVQGAEKTPLLDCALAGNRATWTQHVQKPLRLTLRFQVVINGGELTGAAKAALLPASRVFGRRR